MDLSFSDSHPFKEKRMSVFQKQLLIFRESRSIFNNLHMRPFIAKITGIENNAAR